MTRVTRSRQAASSLGENNVKTAIMRTTTTGAVTKKSSGKTRSNVKKIASQDENDVPVNQINKASKARDSKSKGLVLGSKLLANKNDPLHSTVLALKSPVLRDRTNTTNELVKADAVSKISDKILSNENKKPAAKRTTRNTKKQSVLNTDILQVSVEKYVVKLPKVQVEDHNKNSLSQKEDLPQSKKVAEKVVEKDVNENVSKSQETTPATKKALKRKNISLEDVEKILNADDDEGVEGHETSEDETESVHDENIKKDDKKAKKFFKHKGTEEESKPAVPTQSNRRQAKKGKAAKKTKSNDSTFSPKVEVQRQSTMPDNKKLRTRTAKDYCETSRLSNAKDDEAKENAENVNENNQKGVPIYKTIKLSEEEKKGEPDEIYEFHASQDDGQKGKKRKKTVKRQGVKRAKKATNLPFGLAPQPRKKPAKTASKIVQFTVESTNKANTNAVLIEKKVTDAINNKKNIVTNSTETNYVVPEDHPEMGDSTFAEAPTIKIVSDEKLEGSRKYHLTTTPAPKTAAAGLKVFASKNYSSQPNQQLKKMANHSLIRESMSPIRKVQENNFDVGSPWRAVDTFTRVNKLVQSTPQVNRQALQRVKKPAGHVAELNKKSIGSEETIHPSAAAANKSPLKERSLEDMSTLKQDEPRKFGTVISNMSPTKSTRSANSSNNSTQRSPPQGTSLQTSAPVINQRSPAKAISPPSADPNLPVNYKGLDIEDPTISFDNKENISPKTSPKTKIVAPSPFRFDRLRSYKRLAAVSPSPKTPEKASPAKAPEPEPEAGPSWQDKPKPVMKQTNLRNFLNLEEMPERANISTPYGIFDDVCSTPVSGKKTRKFVDEANIENAFGFDDFDSDGTPSVESTSQVKIATEADVKNSVKGKLFPKARVKSNVPSRISENTVKKTLLRNVLKKKVVEKPPPVVQEQEQEDSDSSSGKENEDGNDKVVHYREPEEDKKKIMLDAISFSDTFDVLSENGEELEAKVPEEIPLFVDLEPAHFTEPPRRSYNKRKRSTCFDMGRYDSDSDEEQEHEKKKAKKKKKKKSHEPHLNKDEKKRMEDWVKDVNRTFDEIEHFDLVVE